MKKFVMVIGFGLMAGSLYAACMGPFCWDDRGASVGGVLQDGNGSALPSKTRSQISLNAPTIAGQEVYCSDCIQSAVCISSGTGIGAYVVVGGTATTGGTLMACR